MKAGWVRRSGRVLFLVLPLAIAACGSGGGGGTGGDGGEPPAGSIAPASDDIELPSLPVQPSVAAGIPAAFDATFSGSDNRGDKWNGTAVFTLMAPDDPSNECINDGTDVQYCYGFTSGKGTWSWPAQGTCPAGTDTVDLSAADSDSGTLKLTIKSPERPELEGTYSGTLAAGNHVSADRCGASMSQVIGWLSIGQAPLPKIPPDFHLTSEQKESGCGDEGCGAQTWTWDVAPVFSH